MRKEVSTVRGLGYRESKKYLHVIVYILSGLLWKGVKLLVLKKFKRVII